MNELQKKIIGEMKVKPLIDAKEEIRKSVDFLKEYMIRHSFFNGFVLGISGDRIPLSLASWLKWQSTN